MCKSISKGSCSYHILPTLLKVKTFFCLGNFLKICGFTTSEVTLTLLYNILAVHGFKGVTKFGYFLDHAPIYRQSEVVGTQSKIT